MTETGPRAELAQRQAAVVAALIAGAPTPPGFDEAAVRAAAAALLRKRAGEVAAAWPLLATAHGPQWNERFAGWAAARPTQGAFRDGWDLARALATARPAAPANAATAAGWAVAAAELAEREARWRYDGQHAPRRRRLPCLWRGPGVVAVQVLGRVWVWRD
ncbi:MAG: hypothetical protein ACM30G_16150 [Micromonosporaceae bacterium]